MNVSAVALTALIIAIFACLGVMGLTVWAMDISPKAIRHRHRRRAFICPCGHDFVFHSRENRRSCLRLGCACQGYSAEVPPATLAELLDGPS